MPVLNYDLHLFTLDFILTMACYYADANTLEMKSNVDHSTKLWLQNEYGMEGISDIYYKGYNNTKTKLNDLLIEYKKIIK